MLFRYTLRNMYTRRNRNLLTLLHSLHVNRQDFAPSQEKSFLAHSMRGFPFLSSCASSHQGKNNQQTRAKIQSRRCLLRRIGLDLPAR
ncbi:MAG: hypothetical protein GPOALKHO_000621 [Sodalis sp.]|nr:MAG: hypothetical protein GPOALKHO_000621 [Sodalis sp.]